MEKRKTKTLMTASMMLMLSVALLAGGTYALWSSDVTLTNHLQAGDLKIKLVRKELVQNRLDKNDGIVKEKTVQSSSDAPVDFTKGTTENVFGMDNEELIVPTSSYTATMCIANNGGTVAFDYNVYLKLGEGTDKKLAEQIKVTITNQNGTETSEFLSDLNKNYEIASGKVLVNDDESAQSVFKVKIEFVDDRLNDVHFDNNEAKGLKTNIDLYVEAVQATSAR